MRKLAEQTWILESVRNALAAWDKINDLYNYPDLSPLCKRLLFLSTTPYNFLPWPKDWLPKGWLSAMLMKKWQFPFNWLFSKKVFSKGEQSLAVFKYIKCSLSLQHQPRMNWWVFRWFSFSDLIFLHGCLLLLRKVFDFSELKSRQKNNP